jgi:hypothetical protein
MRSALRALGIAFGFSLSAIARQAPTVILQPLGAERKLPERLFGASISPFYGIQSARWATGSPRTPEPVTPALQMHVAARALFALLRHPQVTVAQYFMLNFDPKNAFSVFVETGSGYQAVPVCPSNLMVL